MVVLDADVLVTRRLDELIDMATNGVVVTFVNNPPNDDRFFPQSEQLFGPLEQQPYVNAGQLVLPWAGEGRFLRQWADGVSRLDGTPGFLGAGSDLSEPFYFGDQDVLNALLMRPDGPPLVRLEHRLAPHPPFDQLRLVDAERLECRYPDGARPYFLHHTIAKPWLRPTRSTVYSTLLTRLLLGADLVAELEDGDVPLRLRRGWPAAVARTQAHVRARALELAKRKLGRYALRTRLRSLTGRSAG